MAQSLFRLPLEVRYDIYIELLLCPITPRDMPQKRRILLGRRHRSTKPQPFSPADFLDLTETQLTRVPLVYPAILSTCHRVNHEATSILYTKNVFTAHPTLLTALPSLIHESKSCLFPGLSSLRNIRRWHITVRLDCDARYTAQRLEEVFDGAEELSVNATEAMYRASGLGNLLLFGGVRGVGSASVTGSVESVVADWLERTMTASLGAEAPSLEDWRRTAMARDGGLMAERDGDGYYDSTPDSDSRFS